MSPRCFVFFNIGYRSSIEKKRWVDRAVFFADLLSTMGGFPIAFFRKYFRSHKKENPVVPECVSGGPETTDLSDSHYRHTVY